MNTVRPVGESPAFSFSKRTFAEKQDLVQHATEWLASLGIRYYQTRITKYLKAIQRLNEAYQTNSIQSLINEGEFPEIVNSIFESSELVSIYQGLHSLTDKQLTGRIAEFVKGTEFVSKESTKSSSNKGRDIGFELFITSLFARSNYQLDFRSEADLVASDEHFTYFVECKRPQFHHSVRSNVRDAAKQLTKRLSTHRASSKSFGVMALSISKIINPEFKLLVASDEQNIDLRLIAESDKFFLDNQKHWRGISDTRLIGVLMLLQVPAVLKNINMVTTCNFLAANNIVASGTEGVEHLSSIVTRLKPTLFRG